ncbi:winged helix DNA-binding domain-containing protein [Streptomyces qinzhouensis]|uniref:Winged helix DNA-binding domain-containing protein n=1 Tax=Streptomyces qinzhouensis TaxID=2599401 RepID=A0A5B8IM67_9ACTN|nr:winged helix DNA-binding domain-containing protein [Streptomyces qinzhouensis]QDY79698.1 winged helix DNA-binding domain-containing protein [Streptomyces qinzhouensis]
MAPKTITPPPVLDDRALNRATLARQLLLRRAPRSEVTAEQAVQRLVGLQAQNVKPPYYALAARLAGFAPGDLSELMADRRAVRIVTLRSTLHTHTAADALALRPLLQPGGPDRELKAFRARGGLDGVDIDRLGAIARELVETEPRTMKELREALLAHWPNADPRSLAVAARCVLPLVQVTPRGLWGRSGQVRLTTVTHWLGREPGPPADPDGTVLRYLAAFGPASVQDFQSWSGLTRTRDAFERLRPRLAVFRGEYGAELFDLPDAPRPAAGTPAPPRFLPEYDNLLLAHADRRRVVADDRHANLTRRGNQSCPVFLVDGFLAGIWRLEDDGRGGTAALVMEAFGELSAERRAALTEEAERTLSVLAPGSAAYDIRFGSVRG